MAQLGPLCETGGMSDFLSRARGALMGLVVGDAVGTTNEFQPAGSFDPITDMVGGAFYGIEGIPASWRERVHLGEEIDQLARDLVDLRLEAPRTRFDEDLQGEAPSA